MNLYPAVRARMGSWTYYIARMSMRDLASQVGFASEIQDDPTLDHAIQRDLKGGRAKNEIAHYLRHPNRFFSSIVVAAMGGNPTFNEVKMEFTPDQRFVAQGMKNAFGVLSFDGGEDYYALDGQHRLQAIKYLLNTTEKRDILPPKGFEHEEVSVLLVCVERKDDKEFLRLQRRLFSYLNRYAKPTLPGENITMDEDDAFAILTRRLINSHEFFRARDAVTFRVQTEGGKNITPTVKVKNSQGKSVSKPSPYFTTLQTLYDINESLLITGQRGHGEMSVGKLKEFVRFRPTDEKLDELYGELEMCWNAMLAAIPDLRKEPEGMRRHGTPEKDHLLFWPIGQEVLGQAVRFLLDKAFSGGNPDTVSKAKKALASLGRIDWQLLSPPWKNLFIIWDEKEDKKTGDKGRWIMRTGSREPARKIGLRLVLWMIGETDESESDLKREWRNRLVPAQEEKEANAMWKKVKEQRKEISG